MQKKRAVPRIPKKKIGPKPKPLVWETLEEFKGIRKPWYKIWRGPRC